jgi:hypothetical protein
LQKYHNIYTRSSNDPKTRAFYIANFKVLNNVIKEAKKQHCSRLIVKSDDDKKKEHTLQVDTKTTCN